MKVLVAGGTGHTGERLCRRLLRSGNEVRVLTRRVDDPVATALAAAGATLAEGDTTRRWTLWQALEGCDTLVNCAHMRYGDVMVQACRRTGVRRLLSMSSTRRFTRFPCESARAVIAGEAAVEASDLDWTIIRPTMIFGGRRDDNLTKLVAWFRRHRLFPLFGSGSNLVQPIFVEDLVDAMTRALDEPRALRRAITVAGERPLAYREFIRSIAHACGSSPLFVPIPLRLARAGISVIQAKTARRGLTREVVQRMAEDKDADIAEARDILGFSPRSFDQAIALKVSGGAEVEALYPPGTTR